MDVIDADTHVYECEGMWDFLDEEFRPRRPQIVTVDADSAYSAFNVLWLIDGRLAPKPFGQSPFLFRGTPPGSSAIAQLEAAWAPYGAMTMEDIPARLKAMDGMGVDRQVVFPTLFLAPLADDLKLEGALCRAYNRFMADASSQSGGRVMFAATVPWRDVDDAVSVLREAHQLGAMAAWVPGVMWHTSLGDRSLDPFYEALSELGMPLCIHFGWGSPGIHQHFPTPPASFMPAGVMPVLMGLDSIVIGGVLERFPELRLATVEAGSEWFPWLINQLNRRYDGNPHHFSGTRRPSSLLEEGRIYVTCETGEDVVPLLQHLSDDYVLVGSDFPHLDPSHEEDLLGAVDTWDGMEVSTRRKVIRDNPSRFYGI